MMESKRPARSSAGSIRSIRFVAATTAIPSELGSPSSSRNSWLTIRWETWPESSAVRAGAMASISSKNRMQGEACFARLKTSLRPFSDSPTHFDSRVGGSTMKRVIPISPASALAIKVFPVPDGPEKRTPLGGLRRELAKMGNPCRGSRIRERRFSLIPRNPPTSLKEMFGRSLMNSRVEVGSTALKALTKSSAVTSIFNPSSRAGFGVHLELDRGQDAPERRHARLGAEGGDVRADVSVGDLGQMLQVDIFRERHLAGMDLQDLEAIRPLRHADRDFTVEPSRAAQGRVDEFRHVRGADDHDLPAGDEAVHQRQELRHDALFDVSDDVGPLRGEGVHLVEEDDAGGVLPGLVEDLPQLRFALPVELVDELGAVDVDEMGPDLVGNGARDEGLSRSRRPGEENPLGRIDPELGEQVGEFQGKLDHLPDVAQLFFQPADVFVGGPDGLFAGEIGAPEGDGRVGGDPEGPPRAGPLHHEELRPGPEQDDLDAVADDHVESGQQLEDVGDLLFLGGLASRVHGGEDDGVGQLAGDLLDGADLVDGNLGVVPGDAVDLQQALAFVMHGQMAGAGHRGPPAGDPQAISGHRPQGPQLIRIHAGEALPFVLDEGLGDSKREFVCFIHVSPRRATYG